MTPYAEDLILNIEESNAVIRAELCGTVRIRIQDIKDPRITCYILVHDVLHHVPGLPCCLAVSYPLTSGMLLEARFGSTRNTRHFALWKVKVAKHTASVLPNLLHSCAILTDCPLLQVKLSTPWM